MPRPAALGSSRSRLEAAARLRHDLGKAVRFSAPSDSVPGRETTGELRERLAADLGATRAAPGETLDAPAVFDRWWRDDAALFAADREAAARLERIRAAVDVLRPRLPRFAELSLDELRELDAAARVVDEETRALRDALAREARGGRS